MKKLLLLFLLIFITGCSSKTLSCDYNLETDDLNVNVNVFMTFSNNKITKLKNTINYKTDDEDLKSSLLKQYELDNSITGIYFNVFVNDNTITFIQEVDYTIVDTKNNDFEIVNKDITYKEALKSLTDSSYICK